MKKMNFKRNLLAAAVLGVVGFGGMLVSPQRAEATVNDVAVFRALPMVIVWGADAFAENAPTGNPVASDFLLLGGVSGTAGSDIIAGNVFPVITGSLNPASNLSVTTTGTLISIISPAAAPAGGGVLTDNPTIGALNAADSLTAFGVQASTAVGLNATGLKRSFYVASNAAFDIYAQAGAAAGTGDWAAYTPSAIQISTLGITTTGTDGGLTYGASAQSPTLGGTGFVATPLGLNTLAAVTKIYGGGRRTALAAGNLAAQSVRFDVTYNLTAAYGFHLGQGSISVPVTYTIYNP